MRSWVTRWAVGCVALVAASGGAHAQTPPVTPAPPPVSPAPPMAPAPAPVAPAPVAPASPVAVPPAPPPNSPQAKVFGRVLSVDDAVAIALETQPSIQARLGDYAAAAFRVDQEFSRLLPQLSASWTAARSQSVATAGITSTATGGRDTTWTTTSAGPRVSLSQVLFDFGKTWASTEVARRLAEVALEDTELQRQLVTQTVKEAFTNINFAQRLIRVNEQALERADLNLRSARGFFEVGTRPKSDVTRAEVDVANARVDVIRARNAERLARVALATAMGLPATTPLQIEDNLVYQPVTLDPAKLTEEALRQRPESRQARLQADAAEGRVRRASRDFWPDITGSGFYGAQRTDLSEVWELRLSLDWSLFDGGNRIARYREAKANLDAAQARVRATELDVSREVEQAQNNVIESQERIQAAQVAVTSAQENFRLAQGRFDAGVGTILELTDAQLALTLAQNTEAQALADYRIALARLDRATGRR
jgi:outer membrane protein